MPRIDLQVPFAEKDEAKHLGARWDASKKVWFIPDGLDSQPFKRWLPSDPTITIRASRYFLAETDKRCWKCGKSTRVYAFMLAEGHESLEYDEDSDQNVWISHDYSIFVHYVANLVSSVADSMKAITPHYRIDFSKTTQSSYWMNHCEHCGMKQGDFDMHCEPGGAFVPMDDAAAARIVLQSINMPFGCDGDFGFM